MLEPLPFQRDACDRMVSKTIEYLSHPAITRKGRRVPFIQILRAITGAGKTIVLARYVSELSRNRTSIPVVLWTSKTSAVVEQTRGRLSPGGA